MERSTGALATKDEPCASRNTGQVSNTEGFVNALQTRLLLNEHLSSCHYPGVSLSRGDTGACKVSPSIATKLC